MTENKKFGTNITFHAHYNLALHMLILIVQT